MEASKAGFLKNWTDLTYTCESVQLISRIGDEPFEVRFVVDFAGNIVAKNVVTESCVLETFSRLNYRLMCSYLEDNLQQMCL
jgi:hypothetical protein